MKCHIYAQEVMSTKDLTYNTIKHFESSIRVMQLDQYEMPLSQQDAIIILNRFVNPNTRRSYRSVLNLLFGLSIKQTKPVKWSGDMPEFEVLDALIQSCPKLRMQGNLMLHGGLRIGETCYKQPIKGSSILVQGQVLRNGESQSSKTIGSVVLPTWLLEEYRGWQPRYTNSNSLSGMFVKLFKENNMPDMTAHKLRHAFASHYAKLLPIEGLRKQLRHTDIKTTMEYYVHVTEKDILSVMHTRSLKAVS